MRNPPQLHYTLAFTGSASVKRTSRPRQAPALLRDNPLRSGAAAVSRTGLHADLCSAALDAAARAQRSRLLAQMVAATWRALSARLRRWAADWRRRRLERDTCKALRELDDRTLRDLGFHRSEIPSVAREVSSPSDFTLTRAVRSQRGLC